MISHLIQIFDIPPYVMVELAESIQIAGNFGLNDMLLMVGLSLDDTFIL